MTDELAPGVEYRPIEGYPNYLVGSDGSVWTCIVRGSRFGRKGPWRKRKTQLNKGYPLVALCRNGKPWLIQVHILVATAFHGPRPEGQQCRHLDGDRGNPRAENLCWGTQTENEADKLLHGRRPVGSKHGRHRLKEEQVLEIKRLLLEGVTQKAIAVRFGVAETTISSISIRKSWAHLRLSVNTGQ